jgi:hypothetical protein
MLPPPSATACRKTTNPCFQAARQHTSERLQKVGAVVLELGHIAEYIVGEYMNDFLIASRRYTGLQYIFYLSLTAYFCVMLSNRRTAIRRDEALFGGREGGGGGRRRLRRTSTCEPID